MPDKSISKMVRRKVRKLFGLQKNDWVKKISDEIGITKAEAQRKLDYAYDNYGIPASYYYNKKYYEMTETGMARNYPRDQRLNAISSEKYRVIEELCGKDKKKARDDIELLRKSYPEFRVTLKWYYDFGVYRFDPQNDKETIETIIALTHKLENCEREINEVYGKIDEGLLEPDSAERLVNEYRECIKSCDIGSRRIQFREILSLLCPGADQDEIKRINEDLFLTERLLGFSPLEYLVFGFIDKDIHERREFVSSKLKDKVIDTLNSAEGMDLLDSKYETYLRLAPLFKREMVLLDAETGYAKFLDFCRRHSVFVKKDNYDSMGRGVQKVDQKNDVPLEDIYHDITAECRRIALEELIIPSEDIKNLNPDSVNTVRVIVFCENGKASVQDTFMKIGRKGSFVDNGGAGGIFVHVDPGTGIFDSSGVDEEHSVFERHPDHGYTFKGYRLPSWEAALETAIKASLMVPEAKYIGWDLTQTEKEDWVIVEGNSKTQFLAQQMTRGRGVKKEFLNAVNYIES